jgi:AIPR protein
MASSSVGEVREFRFQVSPDHIRSLKDPHNKELQIHHAYVPVRAFAHGKLPDDVNPRSHENPTGNVPEQIETSLKTHPKWFHLLNRGLLVIAQKAWYDNRTQTLHVSIANDKEGGLADGATTDRVLAKQKAAVSPADFENLTEREIPPHLKEAYVHVEIISGDVSEMLVPLTGARNTSNQVKEFSLENLGGGFDWLKEVIEKSKFRGRVKYKENDPEPVDIRSVLALLTLFHPEWNKLNKEPVVAYTSKGMILDYYRDKKWKQGYESLKPVVVDILNLYDYIHLHFHDQYEKYKSKLGTGSKLGARNEVRYTAGREHNLALSGKQTQYLIPDGWLYPMLASFRMLLNFPKTSRGEVSWALDPEESFDDFGDELVADVVEQSESLGRNPQSTGKSRPLWNNLRKSMELYRMKAKQKNS